MAEHDIHNGSQGNPQRRLLSKPQRQSGRPLASLLLLLGGLILVGVVSIIVWQVRAQHAAPAQRAAPAGNPGAQVMTPLDKAKLVQQLPPGPHGNRPIYWQTV